MGLAVAGGFPCRAWGCRTLRDAPGVLARAGGGYRWTSVSPAGRRSLPAQARGSGSPSPSGLQPRAPRLPSSRAGAKRSMMRSRPLGRTAGGCAAREVASVGVAESRLGDEIMKALGKIDIVVNNAGTSATSPFEKLTDEFLQQDFDQKLFAAIRLTRLVWPQMKERRWGRIINVLNIGAKAPRGGSAPTSI